MAINASWDAAFQRTVVRWASTTDHIPAYLEPFFASATAATPGWVCKDSTGQTDITSYGFLNIGSNCGTLLP